MPDESPTKAMYHSPGALFGRVVIYSMLIIAAIYFLIPLLVMIITSLKTMGDIRTGHLISWPSEVTIDAWKEAWGRLYRGQM
jgi:glucose/mannose transport system permease protein